MILGRVRAYKRRDFRRGLTCQVVGCPRRARHQWAMPCAINTMRKNPAKVRWVAVCDDCDLILNRTLLAAIGAPAHVLDTLLDAYRQIQADGAYDS